MGKLQQKTKARRRLKKPKKIYTNKPFQNTSIKFRIPKPKVERVYKPRVKPSVYVPRNIQLKLWSRKTPLNKWGLPKYVTPKRVMTKRNQIIDTLINRGIKPSDVDAIKHNYKMLLRAMRGYESAKKQSTKDRWMKDIQELSRNYNLLGFTSTTYDNGFKTGNLRGVGGDTKDAQKRREFFFKSAGDDDYQDESGYTFSTIFYSVDEVSRILDSMGGTWEEKVERYPLDVKRLCNNAGYSVDEFREYYVSRQPLGEPDINKVQVKRYESFVARMGK